ncbi:NFX1-type zinc finger-containing protein 1-like isoform X2 [Rhopilema esculentum]|eukprot:gene13161-3958_t
MATSAFTKSKEKIGRGCPKKSVDMLNLKRRPQQDKRFSCQGIVCKFSQEKHFGFLKQIENGLEKENSRDSKQDIFFHFDRISSGGLLLKRNDEIMYSLCKKNSDKGPSVFRGVLSKVARRSPSEIAKYIQKVKSVFSDEEARSNAESRLTFLTSPAAWECVADEAGFDNVLDLLQVVVLLDKKARDLGAHLKRVINSIAHSSLLNGENSPLKPLLLSSVSECDLETLQNFFVIMIKYVPEKTRAVVHLTEPFSKMAQGSSILYKLLQTISAQVDAPITDMEWKDIPLFLTDEELAEKKGNHFLQLQPMICKGKYNSADEYVEILFRLLREDCFNSLKEGIQKLLDGSLDKRDMDVYHGVRVVGINASSHSGFYLAVKLGKLSKKIEWKKSKKLMYGNLLCLSMNNRFDDVVWTTVASRELLESQQIVSVQLCSELNCFTDSEGVKILSLFQGEGVAVESPTYYRAYAPVLKALQKLETDHISFKDELVYLKQQGKPDFLKDSAKFDPCLVLSEIGYQDEGLPLAHLTTGILRGKTIFDDSQEKAIAASLRHRIGIIQGPPGTGKTFIGVKLTLLLLSLSSKPRGPILMLTYKNHALDEFLKALIKEGCKNVVRVGGGTKDPELHDYNLASLEKEELKNGAVSGQMMQLGDELLDAEKELRRAFLKLKEAKKFTVDSFLSFVNGEQLKRFLLNYPRATAGEIFVQLPGEVKGLTGTQLKSAVESSEDFKKVVRKALDVWTPPQERVLQFARSVETVLNWMSHDSALDTVEDSGDDSGDDSEDLNESGDEEDVTCLLSERQMDDGDVAQKSQYSYFDTGTKAIQLFDGATEILKSIPEELSNKIADMWKVKEADRIKLIQIMIARNFEKCGKEFNEKLLAYEQKCKEYNELKSQYRAMILEKKSVVAMTITGASINSTLLEQLKPSIVIVEEAAELLEAQLIAALGSWTEQLILIGDHKQLRPSVETYSLEKDYNMGISLMERLIMNEFSYATLLKQNRMRPEFAEMLKDIYPNLESNIDRVGKNEPTKCLASSMFFWHHTDKETDARSYFNEKEADRAVKLAMFLVQQGVLPSRITILSAYQGQTSVIRKKLQELRSKLDLDRNKAIIAHTIDNYQGDENDFVIVSLVRSNDKARIGFLGLINRRCVAQSRSRCGLYFIGNYKMFVKSSSWSFLLKKMQENEQIGLAVTLVCPKHSLSTKKAFTADDIDLGTFCSYPCHSPLACGHLCTKCCQPPHQHDTCLKNCPLTCERCNKICKQHCRPLHHHVSCDSLILKTLLCGHEATMACSDDASIASCTIEVKFIMRPCNHSQVRKCFEKEENIKCSFACPKQRECGHQCKKKCGEDCSQGECFQCKQIQLTKAKVEEERQQAVRKELIDEEKKIIDDLLKNWQKEPNRTEIVPSGETAAEYFMVEDKVKKYIQPGHSWFPVVKKIEKVSNYELEKRWRKAKCDMHDFEFKTDLKFHGTDEKAIEGIINQGFRLPQKCGMYGKGIYFATDSSKSAQKVYTKGSNMLLLCDVLIGRTLTVETASRGMTLKQLNQQKFDSLFAKRDTRKQGGVLYDEFVVYKAEQALPKYVIHYEQESLMKQISLPTAASGQTLMKHRLNISRSVDTTDPLEIHYRIAESQFFRLLQRSGLRRRISSIDFFTNPKLDDKFKAKQKALKSKNDPSDYIFAFHGTKEENVEKIMKDNFRMDLIAKNTGNPGQYGIGIYFSEEPDVCFHYDEALLLCKVLPGKCYDVATEDVKGKPLKKDFDSHGALKCQDGYYKIVVVANEDQILPCYYINSTKEK